MGLTNDADCRDISRNSSRPGEFPPPISLIDKNVYFLITFSENTVTDKPEEPRFPEEFTFKTGPIELEGNNACFGTDVLAQLVQGIDDFQNESQGRWKRLGSRTFGVGLLGSAMWIDDSELISSLSSLSGACVVVTKQDANKRKVELLRELHERNNELPGLRTRAFPDLSDLAPQNDGEPLVVGPWDKFGDEVIPTIRSLGFRKRPSGHLVPILHAKLALLGHFWWHDEGADGTVDDVYGFRPKRLWVSSANFTTASRSSLEFGYWTEQVKLVHGAYRFLLNAIRLSEDIDPDSAGLQPEFAPVEFDHDAMLEAAIEMRDLDEEDFNE